MNHRKITNWCQYRLNPLTHVLFFWFPLYYLTCEALESVNRTKSYCLSIERANRHDKLMQLSVVRKYSVIYLNLQQYPLALKMTRVIFLLHLPHHPRQNLQKRRLIRMPILFVWKRPIRKLLLLQIH